jgi:hypothetical protein
MPVSDEPRWLRPGLLLEIFVLLNLGFLTFDIYLAHSVNGFRQRAEYIPLYFSALAPVFILAGLAFQARMRWLWKALGHVVGWSAILIGLTGVVLHLDSSFFYERTIRSLTYSAPFAAPLAYTGLGFLLLLNRLQEPNSESGRSGCCSWRSEALSGTSFSACPTTPKMVFFTGRSGLQS